MSEKYENYIKDLSPELQQKAKECKSKEELLKLLAENDVELPEEALEMVSGGILGLCESEKPDSEEIEKNMNKNLGI